jgi:hypothetical protein
VGRPRREGPQEDLCIPELRRFGEAGSHGQAAGVARPRSELRGLSLPGYGLGKAGWVTIYVDSVPKKEREVLVDFVEESYRTIAPKTLVKQLD